MQTITYFGPFEAVYIPALGLHVQRANPVSVDDEVGDALLWQQDWQASEAGANKEKPK